METETETGTRPSTGICHKFAQTGRCTIDGCRYRHEAGGSITIPPPPSVLHGRNWAGSLARPDATLPSVMKKIVADGLKILNSAESEARQSAIKTLGSDVGRAWVAKVLETTYRIISLIRSPL
jgi:hypothetical protein